MKEIDKEGYFKDEILVSKCRLLEDQELKIVGGLEDFFDLDNFIGLKSCVPLVSRHSPLAVSIAMHMHYNVNKHIGAESTYRMSLLNVKILGGKQLFKEVSNDCIYCMKLRKRYCEQLMGPLSSSQISMSPIFYFVTVDMWGPILIYTPGYEKRTRNRKMEYEAYMLVFACCVTGGINCQIIEKRDTTGVMDGFNRFFSEVSVPKIVYSDKDGALIKALREGSVDILDMQNNLHREQGIYFETCLPQQHYKHGRIERRIRMIQESLNKSEIRGSRHTATDWQTIAKLIERQVNNIPLGYLYHQGNANPLLKVLTPGLLKIGTFSNRAPHGVFDIPDLPLKILEKTLKKYNL